MPEEPVAHVPAFLNFSPQPEEPEEPEEAKPAGAKKGEEDADADSPDHDVMGAVPGGFAGGTGNSFNGTSFPTKGAAPGKKGAKGQLIPDDDDAPPGLTTAYEDSHHHGHNNKGKGKKQMPAYGYPADIGKGGYRETLFHRGPIVRLHILLHPHRRCPEGQHDVGYVHGSGTIFPEEDVTSSSGKIVPDPRTCSTSTQCGPRPHAQ